MKARTVYCTLNISVVLCLSLTVQDTRYFKEVNIFYLFSFSASVVLPEPWAAAARTKALPTELMSGSLKRH